MEVLKSLFSSKKFVTFFSSGIVIILNDVLSLGVNPESVLGFVVVTSAYLFGQGWADQGKEAQKEANKININNPGEFD